MASGLRPWLVLVLLLLAGVVGWGLLPQGVQVTRRLPSAPEYQRFAELQGELARLSWLYQRGRRRELLTRELETGSSQGASLVYGLPPEAPDSLRRRLSRAVERQLDGMGLGEPVVPVGVYVLPDSFGSHPIGLPHIFRLSPASEYYLAPGEDDPFCIIASFYPLEGAQPSWRPPPLVREVVEITEVPLHRRNVPNVLGLCRFFARYGQPGSAMMDWLRGGAARFAEEPLGVDHHLRYDRGPARGPFGKRRLEAGAPSVRTLQCLAGDEDVCADLVLDVRVLPERRVGKRVDPVSPLGDAAVDFVVDRPRTSVSLIGVGPALFSVMESDFGPARFREFWRSSLDPEEAFQEAFGQPMGLWIMACLRRYVDPPSTGPGVPARATLITFLLLGMLMGAAVRMGRR